MLHILIETMIPPKNSSIHNIDCSNQWDMFPNVLSPNIPTKHHSRNGLTMHQVPAGSSGQRVHPAGKLPQGATLVSAQTDRQCPNLATGSSLRGKKGRIHEDHLICGWIFGQLWILTVNKEWSLELLFTCEDLKKLGSYHLKQILFEG